MTPAPHAIGIDATVETAGAQMRTLGVHHLPVIEGGVLRGILSEREVVVLEGMAGVDPSQVRVEQAMSAEPYSVSVRAPLARVAEHMATHRYGCAVVMDGSHVSGVFTATDALRALGEVLSAHGSGPETMAPCHVQSVITAEHAHLRALLELTQRAAERLRASVDHEGPLHALRDRAHKLRGALLAHLDLEERVLVPAVHAVPGFGPDRAAQVLTEHRRQAEEIERVVRLLDDRSQTPHALADELTRFLLGFRADMDTEEESLLEQFLLRDEMVVTDLEVG